MKKTKYVVIVVVSLISLRITMIGQKSNNENLEKIKIWRGDLNADKLPDNAIELELEYAFPNSDQEKNGQYIAQAFDIDINDLNGNIYIADSKGCKIIEIDNNGKYIREMSKKGQGPGEMQYPSEIFSDKKGQIYLYDGKNSRITIFDKDIEYINSFKIFKPYSSYHVNTKGLIYLNYTGRIKENNDLIEIINNRGELISSFGSKILYGANNSLHMRESNQAIIAIDEKDDVYLLWRNINIFRKYTSLGELIYEGKINSKKHDELSNKNIETLKNNKEDLRLLYVNQDFCYDNGKFYSLRTYPRLTIYEITEKGEIINTYWANTPFQYLARRILVRHINNTIKIYALQLFPEAKLEVYKIKK